MRLVNLLEENSINGMNDIKKGYEKIKELISKIDH